VKGEEDYGIDVAAGKVLLEALDVRGGLRGEEHHLQSARRKLFADAAQQSREQRIEKQARAGFWDDDSDRLASTRGNAPGCSIGDVAQLGRRPFDGGTRFQAHRRIATEHAGGGRSRDSRQASHLGEGDRRS